MTSSGSLCSGVGGCRTIRVDYAGPGGTCEGLRMVGLANQAFGIEWDAAACATRAAAGHLTIRADLATYRPFHAPGSLWGYWASPPCQTFSGAGGKTGQLEIDRLGETILAERWGDADLFDNRTRHVIDAARNATTLGAAWISMEQVPEVLPLWRALAHVLERHGYSVWCGVLCAADFGVPQTRRRAILMASRERCVQHPTPTHAERPGLFGESPWVSMAEALGREFRLDRRQNGAPVLESSQPAPTVTAAAGGKGVWVFLNADGPSSYLTLDDALSLQAFRPDYPVQGSRREKHEQIGNAVPPLMAAHIVATLAGVDAPAPAGFGTEVSR